MRELTFIEESYEQNWAKDMGVLLREINREVKQVRVEADHLEANKLKEFEIRYDKL